VACGNGQCDYNIGETAETCAEDCGGDTTPDTCSVDSDCELQIKGISSWFYKPVCDRQAIFFTKCVDKLDFVKVGIALVAVFVLIIGIQSAAGSRSGGPEPRRRPAGRR